MNKNIDQQIELHKARVITEERRQTFENSLQRYEDPVLFGDFIYRLRKKYKWSRKYLARHLGLNSESSIMNFEKGGTTMKPPYTARFCKITPDNLTIPILYSMFDNDSLEPPCRCVCHQDLNNSIPSIYDDDGRCILCDHSTNDGRFSDSGHWFKEVCNEES